VNLTPFYPLYLSVRCKIQARLDIWPPGGAEAALDDRATAVVGDRHHRAGPRAVGLATHERGRQAALVRQADTGIRQLRIRRQALVGQSRKQGLRSAVGLRQPVLHGVPDRQHLGPGRVQVRIRQRVHARLQRGPMRPWSVADERRLRTRKQQQVEWPVAGGAGPQAPGVDTGRVVAGEEIADQQAARLAIHRSVGVAHIRHHRTAAAGRHP